MVEHVWPFGIKNKTKQDVSVRTSLFYEASVRKVVMESHLATAMLQQVVHLLARSWS